MNPRSSSFCTVAGARYEFLLTRRSFNDALLFLTDGLLHNQFQTDSRLLHHMHILNSTFCSDEPESASCYDICLCIHHILPAHRLSIPRAQFHSCHEVNNPVSRHSNVFNSTIYFARDYWQLRHLRVPRWTPVSFPAAASYFENCFLVEQPLRHRPPS